MCLLQQHFCLQFLLVNTQCTSYTVYGKYLKGKTFMIGIQNDR